MTAGSLRAGGLFIFAKEMINIAIKLAASITYTADGSQTNFSIPFDYLRPSFVHVAVNDAEVYEGFTVSNRGNMFDTAPAKDALVEIYRKTPTSRLVSWADASILKATDMTIAEVQQLHILEEASDWSKTNSIVLDEESGAWQGRKCRVSNVADPKDAQDVVTKHYLENTEDSFVQRMNAIKTQTEQFATTAGNSKDNAYNSAQSAGTSATNAKNSADSASTSKEAAQSAATTASNFAADARSSASEAKTYRDAASTYAANSKNYSENVNVFIPSVSSDGVLSWTNKAGLANPPAVNIGNGGSNVTVDNTLSDSSANPVQNKVIKAALDNRAVLDDVNTFTSPNNFDIIYMKDGIGSVRWYSESPSFVIGSINSKNYTGNAATATKATKDSEGNVITNTYSKKADFDKVIKDLDVAFQEKVDKRDLADVATSGSYKDLSNKPAYVVQSVNNVRPDENGNVSIPVSGGGSNVTVDTTLSSTSTNAIANKTVYDALNKKLDKTGTVYEATKATQDGYGNVIASTYARKVDLASYVKTVNNTAPDESGNVNITVSGGSDITVDDTLSSTSTNAIQNKVVYNALTNKVSTDIYSGFALIGATSTIVWRQGSQAVGSINASSYTGNAASATKALQDAQGNIISSTYIKFINGVAPDTSGNVNVNADGGGVSTSVVNNWSAQQTFQRLKFNFESFATSRISGAYDSPAASVAVYSVTGAFALDMSTLAGMLANGESTLFTAYIASNASYALSITNAGTLKYVGSAADLAITNSGLLLNVLMTKNTSGAVTSIAQASKLS